MASTGANFFATDPVARRYARGRPFFHPIVRDAIVCRRSERVPYKRALDIACGTGLSTRILAEIAGEVTGIDVSPAMLAEAMPLANVCYQVSAAESMPFADQYFDLATVGLAFHWLDRDRFLAEARRVLCPAGELVIYHHGFCGQMACNPAFANWHRDSYLTKYPIPRRDVRPFGETEAAAARFTWCGEERFRNYWPFSVVELADYLVTQSNVIAAVDQRDENCEAARAWLSAQCAQFFRMPQEVFVFEGRIAFLRVA